jgi:hypothetical protein
MDTVVLIVNDPGDGTRWSHGPQWSIPWWDPRLQLWLLRCSPEAAEHYCRQGGGRVAPAALQSVDR